MLIAESTAGYQLIIFLESLLSALHFNSA